MARISLNPPRTPLVRLADWWARRRYGRSLDPVSVLAHHRQVLRTQLVFELQVERWKQLDARLKHLALMTSASSINCSWCLDFGQWAAPEQGIDAELARLVPDWRRHRKAFTETEQLVMEYAEAMTATPPAVTDGLSARLRELLGEPALVELTAMVAVENLRSRINSAFGLVSQGFATDCAVPSKP